LPVDTPALLCSSEWFSPFTPTVMVATGPDMHSINSINSSIPFPRPLFKLPVQDLDTG